MQAPALCLLTLDSCRCELGEEQREQRDAKGQAGGGGEPQGEARRASLFSFLSLSFSPRREGFVSEAGGSSAAHMCIWIAFAWSAHIHSAP